MIAMIKRGTVATTNSKGIQKTHVRCNKKPTKTYQTNHQAPGKKQEKAYTAYSGLFTLTYIASALTGVLCDTSVDHRPYFFNCFP